MKTKTKAPTQNNLLAIIAIVLAVIAIGFGIFNTKSIKDIKSDNRKGSSSISSIEYSIGGGMGTIADTASKIVTISNNGKVVFSNSYNASVTESFTINSEKTESLMSYVENNLNVFSEKDRSDNAVLDGPSSHITVKMKNGDTYETGGYAAGGKDYKEMVDKILEAAGESKFNNYCNKVSNLQ